MSRLEVHVHLDNTVEMIPAQEETMSDYDETESETGVGVVEPLAVAEAVIRAHRMEDAHICACGWFADDRYTADEAWYQHAHHLAVELVLALPGYDYVSPRDDPDPEHGTPPF